MRAFDLVLMVALAICLFQLVKTKRQLKIVRHLFIHSSDQCSYIIKELSDSATIHITRLAMTAARSPGYELSAEGAGGEIPEVIVNGFHEWSRQKDQFQATLRLNGIPPLNRHDLDDLTWKPGTFKPAPWEPREFKQ